MKTISKYLLLLAAAVFTFTACEKTVEREPSPLDAQGAVLFASAGGTFELNMSKDPLETTVTLFRTSNLDQADTINLEATAHPVFQFDPKVIFAPGDKKVDLKITFATGEADSTYTMKLAMPKDKVSPYLDGQTEFNYTVKLVLWSELRTGVFVEQTVGPAVGAGVNAWYVQYQVAENADGSQKIRIINPYASFASGPADAEGIFDGNPWTEDGDVDTSKDYNFILNVSTEGEVTFPDLFTFLGIGWGDILNQFFVDYALGTGAVGTYGRYDVEKKKIVFDAQDNTMLFGAYKSTGERSIYGVQVNFVFYLSKAAYLADQTVGPEPVDATLETYVGAWAINALNVQTDEPVSANVTVTSYDDPEKGQFYALEGLFEDVPVVYGYFDEATHLFKIQASRGNTVEIEGTTYVAFLYMLNANYYTSSSITLDIAPDEAGGLVTYDESEAIGFVVEYVNPNDQTDYKLGDSMYQISFAAADAAGAPARKAAPKRVSGKKMMLPTIGEKIR